MNDLTNIREWGPSLSSTSKFDGLSFRVSSYEFKPEKPPKPKVLLN